VQIIILFYIHVPCNVELESVPLLWWCGRGYNLSLTWDQPIGNHNHPISSTQTQSSPAHMCSCSRSGSLRYASQ